MRVRIDGSPYSLGDDDLLFWMVNENTLLVHGQPGTRQPSRNHGLITFQIGDYRGPGTYSLDQIINPRSSSSGEYAVIPGLSPAPTQIFQTMGQYKGSVRITAVDTTLGTIVGKFEFSAAATLGTGVVHLTEGSFRIHH